MSDVLETPIPRNEKPQMEDRFPDEPAVFDEAELLAIDGPHAADIAAGLPYGTRFHLRAELTPVQRAFLDRNGFAVFARVATRDEVAKILAEFERVGNELIASGKERVYGVPVWIGRDPEGKPWVQRMGFLSVSSEYVREFVRHARFEPIRTLIGEDARIGDEEKDGVVFNRYARAPGSLRPDLAWHTDGLRDVFYNRALPGPMLNVGLHFDRIRPTDGGLRLLPGTHRQGMRSMLLEKIHFVSNDDDPREVAVETWPGDLTVHDGRMWHRVKGSPHSGWKSLRHSMYVPYVRDAYQPKNENSPTPAYLRFFDLIIKAKRKLNDLRASRARLQRLQRLLGGLHHEVGVPEELRARPRIADEAALLDERQTDGADHEADQEGALLLGARRVGKEREERARGLPEPRDEELAQQLAVRRLLERDGEHETHEVPVPLGAPERDHRVGHEAGQPVDRGGKLHPLLRAHHRRAAVVHDLGHQIVLGTEVVVEARLAHPHPARELAKRCPGDPALRDQHERFFQDLGAARRLARRGRWTPADLLSRRGRRATGRGGTGRVRPRARARGSSFFLRWHGGGPSPPGG
jgi:phytanoyl-CoA hydroxylase